MHAHCPHMGTHEHTCTRAYLVLLVSVSQQSAGLKPWLAHDCANALPVGGREGAGVAGWFYLLEGQGVVGLLAARGGIPA